MDFFFYIWWPIPIYKSEPPYVLVHMGTGVSLVLAACPHFSRARYFFFFPHQQLAAVTSSHSLFFLCLFPFFSFLCSSFLALVLSPLLLPYVHTLFNNLRSENAIIECLSIQLDHRDMLFLPISFAPFRRLNNVCVSSTCTLLDAGWCRWESSVCQVCH